jgi:hypothetical protein
MHSKENENSPNFTHLNQMFPHSVHLNFPTTSNHGTLITSCTLSFFFVCVFCFDSLYYDSVHTPLVFVASALPLLAFVLVFLPYPDAVGDAVTDPARYLPR